jgi:hypothetical protein
MARRADWVDKLTVGIVPPDPEHKSNLSSSPLHFFPYQPIVFQAVYGLSTTISLTEGKAPAPSPNATDCAKISRHRRPGAIFPLIVLGVNESLFIGTKAARPSTASSACCANETASLASDGSPIESSGRTVVFGSDSFR